jgi:hypothetical protein
MIHTKWRKRTKLLHISNGNRESEIRFYYAGKSKYK